MNNEREIQSVQLNCPTCGQAFFATYDLDSDTKQQHQNEENAYNRAELEMTRCLHD